MSKKIKVVLVVGHNKKAQGSATITTKISEFNYFSEVAEYVAKNRENTVVLYRNYKGSDKYWLEMKEVLNKLAVIKPDLVLELHFNGSSNSSASGVEVLYSNRFENAKLISEIINEEHCKSLNLKKRSNKIRTSTKESGGYPILKSDYPYFLTESFFGSNKSDCDKVSNTDDVAKVFLRALDKIEETVFGLKSKPTVSQNPVQIVSDKTKTSISKYMKSRFLHLDKNVFDELEKCLYNKAFNDVMKNDQDKVFSNESLMLKLNVNHLVIYFKSYNSDSRKKLLNKIESSLDKNIDKYHVEEFQNLLKSYSGEKKTKESLERIISVIKNKGKEIIQNNGIVSDVEEKKEIVVDSDYVTKKNSELETKINNINLEAYTVEKKLLELLAILEVSLKFPCSTSEKKHIEDFYRKLTDQCNKTLNLKKELERNLEFLESFSEKFTFEVSNTIYFIEVCSEVQLFIEIYRLSISNQFIKTELLLTGTIESSEVKVNIANNENLVIEGFFNNDNYKTQEKAVVNPISQILKESDFLYMKKMDYDNLRAYVKSTPVKHNEQTCNASFILIYSLLLLSSLKNEKFKSFSIEKEGERIEDKIARHFFNIKNNEWKSIENDYEKFFSALFPFVTYSDNPFTDIMKDEGFNKSQESAKTMREDVEAEASKLIDAIKHVFYESYDGKANYGIYSIFQGIADIAYELSTPMTFKIDQFSPDTFENMIKSFMNACVSSIEMQTTLLIHDFIFNFSIKIGDKDYSLNDINNILKTINLIKDISKNDIGTDKLYKVRMEMVEQSSYFETFKKVGFLTYDKKLNEVFETEFKEVNVSGYYLSDEKVGFDEIEYVRMKDSVITPGDTTELKRRLRKLNHYEKVSMYVNNLIKESYIRDFSSETNIALGNGRINISKFYQNIIDEASNTDVENIKMPLFLYNALKDIELDSSKFDSYIDSLEEVFIRYFYNLNKNKKIIKEYIANKMSEEKIIDWSMKMIPSYELIAKAFNFDSGKGLGTLDGFIDSLLKFMNLILGITFDKWKTSTQESVEIRKVRMIEKERYYYIQSIPIMLDWIILNIESSFNNCSKTFTKVGGLDNEAYNNNTEKLEALETDILFKLKTELSFLSSYQLQLVKMQLEKSFITVAGIDSETAKNLAKELTNYKELTNDVFSGFDESTREKIVGIFSKNDN